MSPMEPNARAGTGRRSTHGQLLAAALVAMVSACTASGDAPDRARPGGGGDAPFVHDALQAVASRGDLVVAVGSVGAVAVSRDGGRSWREQRVSTGASLIDVALCPSGDFVALDFYHRLWRAGPEAREWASADIPDDFQPLALACSPADEVWVVGSRATSARSADRGDSWQLDKRGEDINLNVVRFADADHAFILGEFGTLYRSDDGGASWSEAPPLPDEFYPYDAYFPDARTGWVTGRGGRILRTDDGGGRWEEETTAVSAPMYALAAGPGPDRPLAVGEQGVVQVRAASGAWRLLRASRTGGFLGGVTRVTDSRSVAVGGGVEGSVIRVALDRDGARRAPGKADTETAQ